MKSDADTRNALYKCAASGAMKRAFELSDTAKVSLLSALGGAGIGALAHSITPQDEDEDVRGRLLSNILAGAALGGVAGYGGKTLYDSLKPDPPVKPNWYMRNAPEINESDLLLVGGAGTGWHLGDEIKNAIRAKGGKADLGVKSQGAEVAIDRFFNGSRQNIKNIGKDRLLQDVRREYSRATKGSLLRKFTRKGRRIQEYYDRQLLKALEAAGKRGTSTRAVLDDIIRSSRTNPRKVMKAVSHSGGSVKAKVIEGLIAAGLLSGGAIVKGLSSGSGSGGK